MSNERERQRPQERRGATEHDAEGSLDLAEQVRTDPVMRARYVRWRARKAERAASNPAAPIPQSAGSPLSSSLRSRMEPQLKADLSGVRVHTGSDSAAAADQLGARAFTVGSDVHFGAGEFAPGSKEGDRLLAHELTHVVQGQQSGVKRKTDASHDGEHDAPENAVSQPGDPAEQEADAVGDRVAENLHAKHAHGGAPMEEQPGVGQQAKPISAKLQPGALPRSAKPGASAHPPATQAPAAHDPKWDQAKAQLLKGQIPAANQLPPTAGNVAGLRRLHDITSDTHLPDAVRAKFMTELRTQLEGMKDPPQDLHGVLKSIAYGNPDAYLRKGLKGLNAQSAKNEMGGLRRALSLKWLCANCTDDLMKRAHQVDKSLPPVRPPVAQRWPLADKLVHLIKSGKLNFNPTSDVDSGAMIGNFPTGASAWFFAGKDVAENLPPPALKTQLAVGDEYKDGYQIAELPHEMAAPNAKGEGGAARPTALDLCLAPEGKLNENPHETFGRTDPTAPGQVPTREVVLPPMPISAVKRGPLVMS